MHTDSSSDFTDVNMGGMEDTVRIFVDISDVVCYSFNGRFYVYELVRDARR